MKLKTFFTLGAAGILTIGCASSQPPTANERISEVGESYTTTLEQLKETDEALSSFQGRLKELKSEGAETEGLRREAKYRDLLATLNDKIQASRLELASLQRSVAEGKRTYRRQLKNAAKNIETTADQKAPVQPSSN